jgi:hypothetical protein
MCDGAKERPARAFFAMQRLERLHEGWGRIGRGLVTRMIDQIAERRFDEAGETFKRMRTLRARRQRIAAAMQRLRAKRTVSSAMPFWQFRPNRRSESQ